MAFRKTVTAETFNLGKCLLGEFGGVAAFDHTSDQLVPENRDPARKLERRHAAAKRIGFRRRETGTDDRHLHRLFLKQRNAQRLFQHTTQFRRGILDFLQPVATAQIGMHHIALDRSRPDDRHLNNDIVERARLQPRQHRHLRSRFDLKRPQRVGFADHRIRSRVFGWYRCQIEVLALMFGQEIERPSHAAQHA